MKIRIDADGRTIYLTDILSLFRVDMACGRVAYHGPLVDELAVTIEVEPADVIAHAHALDVPNASGKTMLDRSLRVITPARLPTDELDD